MLFAALLVGLLTAYYFGVRLGVMAAGATAGLFLCAAVIPGLTILVYLAVGVGVAGICLVGPRSGARRPAPWLALGWLRRRGADLWRKL
jgi:hypothetical protein